MIELNDADPPTFLNVLFSIGFTKYPTVGGGIPGDRYAGVFLSFPPGGRIVVSVDEIATNASGWQGINQYESSEYVAVGTKFFEYKIPLTDINYLNGAYINAGVSLQDLNSDNSIQHFWSDTTDKLVRLDIPN